MQRLPDTSLTAALANGGRQMFGWGVERHLLAELFDAINVNTKATGNWRKKPPEFPRWPRPKADKQQSEQGERRTSVADVYQRFMRRT